MTRSPKNDLSETPNGGRVAYLVNQYPKVSHTFIRREIFALERAGWTVDRYSIRGWDAQLVDPQDIAEQQVTKYTLRHGLLPLIGVTARTAFSNPGRFFTALRLALRMSRKSIRSWPYHLIYLAHACKILSWINANPVLHMHTHFGTNPTDIAVLLRALGGPEFSFTIHGADEFDNAARLNFDTKVASAKFVNAISWFTRSQLLRVISPKHWPKVKVVHCGLPEIAFVTDTPKLPKETRFLCIGRLCGEKGHLILLEAFGNVVKDSPLAKLVFAGDGEMREVVEAQIENLGLRDNVSITGWISSDQVREEIQNCRVLVQPSLMEGLPVVIMEAMAAMRPVISTYVAGIPELVLPGKTGWLVPASDVEKLTIAMTDAAKTSDKDLIKMGKASGVRVRQRHHIDTEAAKIIGHISSPVAE